MDKNLLEVLACSQCKSNVKEDSGSIVCVECGRRYNIQDGIPVMLLDEKEQIQTGL